MRIFAWLVILLYLILVILIIFDKKEPIIKKIMYNFCSLSKFKKIIFILIYFITIIFSWIFRLFVAIFFSIYLIIILLKINTHYTMNCPNYIDKEDKDLFILLSDYVKVSDILKVTLKNLYKKSKKRAFMMIYNLFNKKEKVGINTLEKIFFRYLFRIDISLANDMIEIINSIEKKNKNKIFRIALLSKFKELCKKLGTLSLNEEDESINFKIVIEKWKIKTKNL